MKKLTEEKIKQILEFTYDKVLQEIENSNIKEKHHNSIIKYHKIKAGLYGFVTGIGGLLWIPITLPINVTLILYLQIKMVASIAHIAGYDLKLMLRTILFS